MKWLFILVSFLIMYGSFYPFDTNFKSPSPADIDKLLGTLKWTGTRGDILGNIVLFVPYGFLGAFLIGRGWRAVAWFGWFPVWTLFLAFGIQYLQIYLPSRSPALNDGLWNMLGAGIGFAPGLAVALVFMARGGNPDKAVGALISFPVVMAGCWVAYRLAPYVPSIDLQSWKDSLKPLLLSPTLSGTSTIRSAAGWMAFAALWKGWRGERFNDLLVVPMVLLVMFGEVLVVKNAITPSNLVGAAAGLGLWWAVKWSRLGYAVAAVVLAGAVVWIGLAPFKFGGPAASFQFIPFHGFLGGSMYVNVQQLFLKLFLYGSLAWLLVRAGLSYLASMLLVAATVFGIELAQIYMPRKSPEITDPVLAMMAGWVMWLLDRHSGAAAVAATAITGQASDPAAATRERQREALRKLERSGLAAADDSHMSDRPQHPRSDPPCAPTRQRAPGPNIAAPPVGAGTARTAAPAGAPETAETPAGKTVSAPADDQTENPAAKQKGGRTRRLPPEPRNFLREGNDNKGRKSFLR